MHGSNHTMITIWEARAILWSKYDKLSDDAILKLIGLISNICDYVIELEE